MEQKRANAQQRKARKTRNGRNKRGTCWRAAWMAMPVGAILRRVMQMLLLQSHPCTEGARALSNSTPKALNDCASRMCLE